MTHGNATNKRILSPLQFGLFLVVFLLDISIEVLIVRAFFPAAIPLLVLRRRATTSPIWQTYNGKPDVADGDNPSNQRLESSGPGDDL